jgi:hypothetical protein
MAMTKTGRPKSEWTNTRKGWFRRTVDGRIIDAIPEVHMRQLAAAGMARIFDAGDRAELPVNYPELLTCRPS